MIATDPHFPGLSRLGALLADPGRAAMLWALMDGSARPAGELTLLAGLSPSAGSAHLARLTDGGLLSLEVRGRHRYYRIASPEVAASIETLANLAQATAPLRPVPAVARTVPLEMRHARTCYDHMAGELAVRVYDRMRERGWLAAADGESDGPHDPAAAPAPLRLHLPGLERAARPSGRRARRRAARCLARAALDRAGRQAARAAHHARRAAPLRGLAYRRLTPRLQMLDENGDSDMLCYSRA